MSAWWAVGTLGGLLLAPTLSLAQIHIQGTVPISGNVTSIVARNQLSWTDNGSGLDSFTVERAPGACAAQGAFAPIATIPANVVAFEDVVISVVCYRVKAFNSFGVSDPSNTADGKVPGQ